MKQDIITPVVTNVLVAVIPRDEAGTDEMWDIHVVNLRETPMTNVLITSQGHGEIGGVDKTTTVLRHFHQSIAPGSALKIEPIHSDLFGISNEYWISFNDNDIMLDKRFVFKAGDISADGLKRVPVLNKAGVFIK